jgi:hypothetical protein
VQRSSDCARLLLFRFAQVQDDSLQLAREAASFGALGCEKGFQISALCVLRCVFVSLLPVFADFNQPLNHLYRIFLIHDGTSVACDATRIMGLDG